MLASSIDAEEVPVELLLGGRYIDDSGFMVEAGGGRLSSIVKLNTYLTDIRYRADLIPIRAEFFGKRLPASTLITTPALAHPDWLIEVEAIAVI